MTKLQELLEEAGNLESKVRLLDNQAKSSIEKKKNLESDIGRLSAEQKALETKVKDLKKTLADEIAKALAPAQEKIKELEEKLESEIKKAQEERGEIAAAKRNYEDKASENEKAIKKNQDVLKSLESEKAEVEGIKKRLLSVIDTIKGVLK